MNKYSNDPRLPTWLTALILTGFLAACGGGGGDDGVGSGNASGASTAAAAAAAAGLNLTVIPPLITGMGAGGLGTGPAPVNLLSVLTNHFAILTKTGITDVPASPITGNVGASPISGAAILVTCAEVTGTIFSVDAAGPLPCRVTDATLLTAAIGDMTTAYTDAAGRAADFTELGAGAIGGMVLPPAVYKWGTGVSILTDVVLAGGPNDVWIFQIAGDVTMASAKKVTLVGGALAKNIFWQVGGPTGVAIDTTAHFEGIILAVKAITLNTGASVNGRLLAQTAVTLKSNTVVQPAP